MTMRLAYAAAILAAIPYYVPRLLRGFWLDEAGTYWMAYEGLGAAIDKCAHWPGQSILYGALASLFCLEVEGPWREPLLRLPSLFGIGLMLFFCSRLAAKAVGEMAAWCTFVLLLFHPASLDLFAMARPYGLAAAAVAGSYYFLYEWVETRSRRAAASYAVATALIFYLHYLFSVALAGQALYLAWVFLVERRTERWRDLVLAYAGVGVLLLPLAAHMRLLVRDAYTLPVAGRPSLRALAKVLVPSVALVSSALALAGAFFLRRKWQMPGHSVLALLLGWFAAGTLVLFVIARVSPHAVFIPRYLGSAIPGEALLLGVLGAVLLPGRWAAGWACLIALATTANPLEYRQLWLNGFDDARPILEMVRQVNPAEPPPLFFQSGLIESNFLDWRKGPEGTYLFSELSAYPVANRVYPLPIRFTAQEKPYLTGLLDGELKQAPMILFLTRGDPPAPVIEEFTRRGYRLEIAKPNVYSLALFRR
ncbi:MAG: hypothetical protein K2X03_19355 [Bryobacteraceae bacterium]|nr:hypothetical protein [Bryobacteraceae bacterium]